MARNLILNSLRSRIVRTQITQNSSTRGLRTIGNARRNSSGLVQRSVNFLGRFFGSAIEFTGWIIKPLLSTISFSFTSLWGLIVQTTSFIYNFDWNITNEAIDSQLRITKQILAGQVGETLGNAVGYLACGVVPSASILVFNEPLALYLLKEVGEEALDEFAANLSGLIRISFQLGMRNLFLTNYKNIRKAIKTYVRSRSDAERTAINQFFGGNITQAIEVWGEQNSKPWSFRLAVEERIQRIQNPVQQEFIEEFYEETLDACVEAGYVVANSLDSWVLQKRQEQSFLGQQEQLIELQPDRNAPEEKLYFSGGTNAVRTQIVNSLNQFQLLDNRDVGQIVGEPLIDSVRRPPKELALRIYLRGNQSPPWLDQEGKSSKRAQITIPNLNRARIDWERIKRAVGGRNGYLWGRFLINAKLDDGNKISFYASSETEGQQIARNLIELTNANLTTLNITEEKKEGARLIYPSLYKEVTRIYPASMTIINQTQILRANQGIATSRGVYKRRRFIIPLYTENRPDNFNVIVQELLRRDSEPN